MLTSDTRTSDSCSGIQLKSNLFEEHCNRGQSHASSGEHCCKTTLLKGFCLRAGSLDMDPVKWCDCSLSPNNDPLPHLQGLNTVNQHLRSQFCTPNIYCTLSLRLYCLVHVFPYVSEQQCNIHRQLDFYGLACTAHGISTQGRQCHTLVRRSQQTSGGTPTPPPPSPPPPPPPPSPPTSTASSFISPFFILVPPIFLLHHLHPPPFLVTVPNLHRLHFPRDTSHHLPKPSTF